MAELKKGFEKLGFDIPVFVISKEKLEDILHNAPDWRGNNNKKPMIIDFENVRQKRKNDLNYLNCMK